MSKELQEIVAHAVAQALKRQLPKLQAELVECVLAELPVPPAAAAQGGGASPMPSGLVQAIAGIHGGSTQKEILKELLDASTSYEIGRASCRERVSCCV